MPKGIDTLDSLQVLKGFLIGSSKNTACRLGDLRCLTITWALTYSKSKDSKPKVKSEIRLTSTRYTGTRPQRHPSKHSTRRGRTSGQFKSSEEALADDRQAQVGDIEGDASQVKQLRRSSSDALQDMISGEELSLYGSAPNNADSAQVDAPKVEQSDKVQAVPTAEELETKSVEGQDCFVRKERDPSTNDFLVRHQDPSSNICLRCGGSGHNMFSCRSEYSPDDLKDMGPRQVSCYSCGQSGHLGSACGETSGSKSPALCYRCGEEGHFARRCTNHVKVHFH
ncbi:cingulin-like isoform X12 [Fagus crenata]